MTDQPQTPPPASLRALVETMRREEADYKRLASAHAAYGGSLYVSNAAKHELAKRYADELEAALLAAGPARKCPDGWHESGTHGYGHQKCVKCGMEWDFNPPTRAAGPAREGEPDCPACKDGECPLHLGTPSHLGASLPLPSPPGDPR